MRGCWGVSLPRKPSRVWQGIDVAGLQLPASARPSLTSYGSCSFLPIKMNFKCAGFQKPLSLGGSSSPPVVFLWTFLHGILTPLAPKFPPCLHPRWVFGCRIFAGLCLYSQSSFPLRFLTWVQPLWFSMTWNSIRFHWNIWDLICFRGAMIPRYRPWLSIYRCWYVNARMVVYKKNEFY